MSRSGQLSGSAILSGGDSTATSLLSKQLEQRPDVASSRRNKSDYFEHDDHHHHKLTREDNSKPIASEKIKKKHVEKEVSVYLTCTPSHSSIFFLTRQNHSILGQVSFLPLDITVIRFDSRL